ncbi:hypothetical protein C3L33_21172, partial [Rhododendron williamsianum]
MLTPALGEEKGYRVPTGQRDGFALCVEKDWSQWRLGWDFKLLMVSYTGIFALGAMFTFMAWCVQMRGPLFVSAFNPLTRLCLWPLLGPWCWTRRYTWEHNMPDVKDSIQQLKAKFFDKGLSEKDLVVLN